MPNKGLLQDIRVPIDKINPVYIPINSASCYPKKENINCYYLSWENNNTLKIKLINTTQRGKQIEMVVMGRYDKKQYKQNIINNNWVSWIRIDIPIKQIDNIINQLQKIKSHLQQKSGMENNG